MVFKELLSAIDQIAAEKDLNKEIVLQTVEMAFAAAYKKEFGKKGQKIVSAIDPLKGQIKIYEERIVVDKSLLKKEDDKEDAVSKEKLKEALKLQKEEFSKIPPEEIVRNKILKAELARMKEMPFRFKPQRHLMLSQVKKIVKKVSLGDRLLLPLPFKEEFGRIAAQTAKQVIIQKIREAERDSAYDEYKKREGQIVNGFIQKIQGPVIYVDLGKAAGIFPQEEQIYLERYREQDRMSFYVSSVEPGQRGPIIFLSRAAPEMVEKMFELEVPEIANKAVKIKAIAREAGSRSKVAVYSSNSDIDPIGACVGQRGSRISAIINEFGAEKIDIVKWSRDEKEFIINALSPARILSIDLDERIKTATAWVSADQQSLAIGKRGQNVRLAVKLTGWKIDVRVKDETATQTTEPSEKNGKGKDAVINENKAEVVEINNSKENQTAITDLRRKNENSLN